MHYLRVVRWATLIRRIQRQGIHQRIHPVMHRVFRHEHFEEAAHAEAPEHLHTIEVLQRQNEEAIHPERVGEAQQVPAAQPIEAQQVPEHQQELGRRPRRRGGEAQQVPEQQQELGHRPRRRAAIYAQQRMRYMR